MAWRITEHISHTANHRLRLEQDATLQSVQLDSQQPLALAENDHYLLAILGRVRPYNQDYPQTDSAEWLLALYQQHHEAIYPLIAGFFIVLVANKKDGSLHIINDHVGSIPCYIDQRISGQLRISDNMPALQNTAEPAHCSAQALFNYMYFHCIPSPESIYQHITKLAPGVSLFANHQASLTIQPYYRPDFTPSKASEQQLLKQCHELISEAVRRNISDNCAAFLSGGLDSSTVAGMLARHSTTAKTYSIGFDAKGYDETEYAELTARHFGTEHKVHYLQPEEITRHFSTVAGYFNEPFGNSSAMAAYVCANVAKQDGIRVMLAGDGGDEIFAGNERYIKQQVFERFAALPSALQSLLRLALDNSLADKLPLLKKGSSYIRQADIPLPGRLDTYNFLNRFDLHDMFTGSFLQQVDTQLPLHQKQQRYQECKSADVVDRMMYLDWKFTLADNDLVKVSQMCQLADVEVRYPLFEKELVDFSCTIPSELKAPNGQLRHFYKNAFRGFLADGTINKSKHGFGLPFGVWMKQQPELQQLAMSAMQRFKARNILQPAFIDHAIRTYQQGHAGYYGELVWIIVVLELWLEQHEAGYAA